MKCVVCCCVILFVFISIFIDGKDTPETAVIENHERDQLRNPKRGLVATLQAVYEPPPSEGDLLVDTKSSISSSLLACSGKMLARPWQTGNNIHGSETASNPPKPSSQQLGAGSLELADGFSFGRSRSATGRALNRLSTNELSVISSVNGAIKGSHAIVNHHQKSSAEVPSRRFSEPFKRLPSASSIMVEDTRVKADNALPADMVDNKSKVHTNKMSWKSGMIGLRENYEDEELQYGPGIVNKLKSRYLSRTLREKPLGESRRPSLRRATSLEDWLDKDISPTPPHRLPTSPVVEDDASPVQIRSTSGKSDRRPVSLNIALSALADSKLVPTPNTSSTKIQDLKKTGSVESFSPPTRKSISSSDLPMPSPVQSQQPSTRNSASPLSPNKIPVHLLLSKDAIVIVEKEDASSSPDVGLVQSKKATAALPTPTCSTNLKTRRTLPINSRYNVEDPELPAPDTVRQVKRIFENGTSRKPSTRRSQSAGPGLNRVPLSAANQSIEKFNVQRMNQVNLTNVKSTTIVTRKQSDTTSPKINDFPLDTKPVIITKPAPIGPKPVVMSPKPTNIPPPPSSVSGTRVLSNPAKSRVVAQSTRTTSSSSKTRLPASASSPCPIPLSIPLVKNDFSESEDDVGSELVDTDVKTISKVALDNIRSESTSVQFNFNEKKENKTQVPMLPPQSKQVGVIRPQLKPVSSVIADKQLVENNILLKTPVTSQLGQLPEDQKSKSIESTFDKSLPKIQAPAIAASTVLAQDVLSVVPPVLTAKFQDSTSIAPLTTLSKASSNSTSTKDSSSSIHSVVQPPYVKKETPVTAVTVKVLSPASQIIKVAPETQASANENATTNNASIAKSTPSSGGVPREQKKPWHQQPETTTVFNFVNENKKIDHIRNEGGSSGILLYKVKGKVIAIYVFNL